MTPEEAVAALAGRRKRSGRDKRFTPEEVVARANARSRAISVAKTALVTLHKDEFDALYEAACRAAVIAAGWAAPVDTAPDEDEAVRVVEAALRAVPIGPGWGLHAECAVRALVAAGWTAPEPAPPPLPRPEDWPVGAVMRDGERSQAFPNGRLWERSPGIGWRGARGYVVFLSPPLPWTRYEPTGETT